MNKGRVLYSGLGLSIAGAISDFISASLILASTMTSSAGSMTVIYSYNTQELAWIISLFVLGGLILATGALGVSSLGMKKMRVIGSLMALFGAIMIGYGLFMFEGMSPPMMGFTDRFALGGAMLLIGALMILNGYWMTRRNQTPLVARDTMAQKDNHLKAAYSLTFQECKDIRGLFANMREKSVSAIT